LQTSCPHGGRYGFDGVDGGQGEAVRVPQATGTLVKLPVADRTVGLDGVPDGYRAMAGRQSLKVLIAP
jgi:hypothetical protein